MKKDIRILLAEDNKYHAALIKRGIAERHAGSTLDVFSTGRAVLEAAQKHHYDIAVIEQSLPDFDGLELLALLRKDDLDLPVIITSTSGSEQLASEAIRSGAAEYLVKDSSFHLTIPRLIGEVYHRRMLVLKNRDLEQRLKQKDQVDFVKIAAGTLSHEINNPLMTILGTSELLLEDLDLQDKELTRKIRIIRKSAQRIESTLSRLRNLSTPAIKDTASGKIIDPRQSRIYTKSKAKSEIV